MKKLITFITFCMIYFSLAGMSYAQEIPGQTCGNAEASDSAKNCCKAFLSNISSTLSSNSGIAGSVGKFNDTLLLLERYSNIVPCPIGYPSDRNSASCVCKKISEITPSPIQAASALCANYLTNAAEKAKCISCANQSGVWTSIGCIQGDLSKFISENVFGWGTGVAFGVSLLCIIYSAFMMQASQGSPEKIKKAQELLTSCIMGLMLIIFSVFILRLIGVNILRIPGFQ